MRVLASTARRRESKRSGLASSLRTILATNSSVSLALCPAVLMGTKRKFYAVVAGRQPGIYETWQECERQTNGFKGQKFRSFPSKVEAEQYLTVGAGPPNSISKPSISANAKGAQVARLSSPFKRNAVQISSSVLEMAPADYELCVGYCTTELNLEQATQATPAKQPAHLSDNLDLVSDLNALYQLEYDGASKGNPGFAGAGALLRHPDGTVVCEVSVGLGKATNNVAEYRGLIAGMRKALDLGIQRIQAQGDSKLVTMQVRGKWKINNPNLAVLCKEATSLLKNFKEFQIRHVDREYNSAADALANKGVCLPEEKFVSSFAL